MRAIPILFPILFVLGSCGSPPKPPTVDPAMKRPVNAAGTVELQVCKSELQNSRILASETARMAESASATVRRLASQQQAVAAASLSLSGTGNSIYTVFFPFASTEVKLPEPATAALIDQARSAALIVMRGRTDGNVESAAEGRIARERAAAVRAYFVQAGVDPARIRTTYQSVGDHAADNGTPAGRARNRRVEIELYSAAPKPLALNERPQL